MVLIASTVTSSPVDLASTKEDVSPGNNEVKFALFLIWLLGKSKDALESVLNGGPLSDAKVFSNKLPTEASFILSTKSFEADSGRSSGAARPILCDSLDADSLADFNNCPLTIALKLLAVDLEVVAISTL